MKSIENYEMFLWRSIKIHFRKTGTGNKKILFFHGFGQNYQVFEGWADHMKEVYTCYLLDLPFHGFSRAPSRQLSPEDWKELISFFIEENKIENFSLVAFSLGGRFAFSLLMENEEKIEKIWLIAPDGIFESFWYKLATEKHFRRVFKYFMMHPTAFHKLLSLFEKSKIVKGPMIRFARKELQSRSNRIRVYKSWVFLKPIKYPNSRLSQKLKTTNVPIIWLLSKSDSIIPWHALTPHIPSNPKSKIIWLKGKHHELIQEAIKHIHIE